MRLEVILKGNIPEDEIREEVKREFFIERLREYHRLLFSLDKIEEADDILSKLSYIRDLDIFNTAIGSEAKEINLGQGYGIRFLGWEEEVLPSRDNTILLKRGLSFGGCHPTTLMCLELLMDTISHMDFPPIRALDLGTGSGILAIMACRLGITEIWAVDIDLESCLEARENVRLNGCDNIIRVICGDQGCIKKDSFDFIMANIIFHTLEKIIKDILSMLKSHGQIIISGILANDMDRFLDLLGKGKILGKKEREGWAAILWQKE